MSVKNIAVRLCCLYFLSLVLTGFTGCAGTGSRPEAESKLRLAYSGRIEEAALFCAVKKDFFSQTGIDAALVKTDPASAKELLSSGQVHGMTCDVNIFSALEKGLPVKLVAGLHSSCLQLLVPQDSPITSVKDLKNKTIGLPAFGGVSMLIASLALRSNGIVPEEEVTWKEYPADSLEKALAANEVDAVGTWDPSTPAHTPFRVLYRSSGTTDASASAHASHGAYVHFYEGFIALNTGFAEKEPKNAVILAKAWMEAADWVGKNPEEAVKIAVDNGYVSGGYERNRELLERYMWMPGVKYAKEQVKIYLGEQKKYRLLTSTSSENELLKKYFSNLLPEWK